MKVHHVFLKKIGRIFDVAEKGKKKKREEKKKKEECVKRKKRESV